MPRTVDQWNRKSRTAQRQRCHAPTKTNTGGYNAGRRCTGSCTRCLCSGRVAGSRTGIFDSCAPISDYRAEDTASAIEAHFRALTHPTHCFRCDRSAASAIDTKAFTVLHTPHSAWPQRGMLSWYHDSLAIYMYIYIYTYIYTYIYIYIYIYTYNVIEYVTDIIPSPKKRSPTRIPPSDDRSHSPFLVRWWRWRSTPVGWWLVGGLYHPSYIGDYSSPRTGNPVLNQPVYIMEWQRFFLHTAQVIFLRITGF